MTIEELAIKYISEAPEYNVDVHFSKSEDSKGSGLISIWIRGRKEYFVIIDKADNTWFLRLIKVCNNSTGRLINEEEYRPLSDDEPEPSLKYVREFIKRTIEGAGIHWYEDEEEANE